MPRQRYPASPTIKRKRVAQIPPDTQVHVLTEDGVKHITPEEFEDRMMQYFDDVAFKHHGYIPRDDDEWP